MSVALKNRMAVSTVRRRMLVLGTHSDASVDLAERRLLVQEVEVDSVHLVPQHHVQHLHGGRRLPHEEKMVRKVTNKWKVTCRWGPAHPSKSCSFFVWDLCAGKWWRCPRLL